MTQNNEREAVVRIAEGLRRRSLEKTALLREVVKSRLGHLENTNDTN